MAAKVLKTPVTAVVDNNRRMEYDIKNEEVVGSGIPVDMLFMGDSITNNWEAQMYFIKYGTVVNRGIGGDRIECVDTRLEGDALQIKPKVLVILIGINNTWDMDKADDIVAEGKARRDFILSHYDSIMKQCADAGQKTLVCSILPIGFDDFRKNLIVEINAGIKALCEKHGLVYVDYHSAMVQNDGVTVLDGHTGDGLHPNSDGYRVMSKVLCEQLNKIFL